jgi:uncharacterized membrane protein YdbT with pleckstrin-like domain
MTEPTDVSAQQRAARPDVSGAPEPRRRLHPLSPVLHSAKSLALIIAAISWQGYAQLGFAAWIGLVVVLLIGSAVLSVVSWFMTGYHVVGRELRVYEGVLWRRTRAIPLERLQSVEVVRPLLAQLSGLAELRLEVVGGAKTEAPLAFLAVRDAAALRDRLLGLAGRLGAPAASPDPELGYELTDAAPGAPAQAGVAEGFAGTGTAIGDAGADHPAGADPTDTAATAGTGAASPAMTGAATTGAATTGDGSTSGDGPASGGPGGWGAGSTAGDAHGPTGQLAGVAGVSGRGGIPPGRPLHRVANRDVVIGQLLTPQVWSLPFALALIVTQAITQAAWGFVGIASTVTAMAGIVLQPARRVLDDWNFRLSTDPTGLRLRHGLVETRSQTIPIDRVQSVRATWPLLWRSRGWLRMRLDIAGFSVEELQKGGPADNLLPVGDLATARRLVAEVLPGVEFDDLPLTAPPRRARWLAPLGQPRIGAGLTDRVFAARSGVLTRRLVLVPYARVQSVRVVQGPVQRLLGLATVYADTAAGNAAAEHRELPDARAIAAELTDRARRARA